MQKLLTEDEKSGTGQKGRRTSRSINQSVGQLNAVNQPLEQSDYCQKTRDQPNVQLEGGGGESEETGLQGQVR